MSVAEQLGSVAAPPHLRLVSRREARLGTLGFVTLIAAIGVAGLALMLVTNVALTQGAFEEAALTREAKVVEASQQAAEQALSVLASPGNLEARARAMGMVPVSSPVMLRLSDGKVLGTPIPATAQKAPLGVDRLMPTERLLEPELQMAAAAVKARVLAPRSDAATEITGESG